MRNAVLSSMTALLFVSGPIVKLDADDVVVADALASNGSLAVNSEPGVCSSGQILESSLEINPSSASPANITTTRNIVGRRSGDDCTHMTSVSNTRRTSSASLSLT